MHDSTRKENEAFENETRRIARLLWPTAQYRGAVLEDGRERDGVFETEECIHLLEATTSRKLEKAQDDIKKLVSQADRHRKRQQTKAVKCWFVTRDEPTADQRKHAEKHRDLVNVLSFAQFQARLIDARAYLAARDNYTFGSIRDPETGKGQPTIDFIEIHLSERASGLVFSPSELVTELAQGGRFVLLGDFGAGKSMTMRFLYHRLRAEHHEGASTRFPVYVNLRDHYGQNNPAEVLERHARSIGFEPASHLVRAWRAGYVHLLLDGFDELSGVSIQGLWRKLQENRFRTMEAVRRIVREHPDGSGLVLSGRAHFFDSDRERKNSLGIDTSFRELSLFEFSEDQIREYLEKCGYSGQVPSWLPCRPLLVAYLAARGLLAEATGTTASDLGVFDPANGWDYLLGRIANREAEIEAGIDGSTVRRILERLATKARACVGGLGPLPAELHVAAFSEICGYPPDERGMVLLQRLPGLTSDGEGGESRRFIDEDFVDACRAGDILDFVGSPYAYSASNAMSLECGIGSLALAIAAKKCTAQGFHKGKVIAALSHARAQFGGHLVADLARLAFEMGLSIDEEIFIRELLIEELELATNLGDVSRVEFQDCYFGCVALDADVASTHIPRFVRCYIGALEGRASAKDLPADRFQACEVEQIQSGSNTTSAVLALDLPLGVRVLLTVLKKLYERRGSGRRENAFYRGLDHRARRLVPEVLEIIRREGLAISSRRGTDTVWLPDRSNLSRVGKIVASPSVVSDRVVLLAKALV